MALPATFVAAFCLSFVLAGGILARAVWTLVKTRQRGLARWPD